MVWVEFVLRSECGADNCREVATGSILAKTMFINDAVIIIL